MSEPCLLMADRLQLSASQSRHVESQSLSFGMQRILQNHSSVTENQPQHQPPIIISHHLHLPTTPCNLFATPLPWRPYFGVVALGTDSVSSAWLSTHSGDRALSWATTGGLCAGGDHLYETAVRRPPMLVARKKARTTFTRSQLIQLEENFRQQKYLAATERSAVAAKLKMTDAQVKTWFQNRRTKWRRQSAEEKELRRLRASLCCQTPQLKLGADDDDDSDCRQMSPSSTSLSLSQSTASLQALQRLQPWSDVTGSRSSTVV